MQNKNFTPKAFLFDLNGTMINDMDYHNQAWHHILTNTLASNISYKEVKKQMYGKNQELLDRVFGKNHFTKIEAEEISIQKELIYQKAYGPYLSLIAGLDNFLEKAKTHKIEMAIGSAAIPFNIDFVLDGLNIRNYFKAIVSASDVEISKPNPETFLKGAKILGIDPADCLVFEDAPKGVEAALNAGMKCIVLTTMHTANEFDFPNIITFIDDYNDSALNQLF